jgi:glycosyltransferase involved in cell wall biosynthesis
VHFGFIGSDWYRDPWLVRQLLPVIGRGARITATGEGMRQEMIAAGLDAARVAVLPHSVDTDRFAPAAEEASTLAYDAVFVGNLVPVKQVNVLLDGWAQVVRRRPGARLCVIGDGPQRSRLEQQAATTGLDAVVDFVGYQTDVVPWLRRARLFVMASASEGLPFALMEAMCTGLVPVVTDVGTIGEVVVPGASGALYRPGDAAAFADHVLSYLEAPGRWRAAREEVLKLRATCSHDAVAAQWADWLDEVVPS